MFDYRFFWGEKAGSYSILVLSHIVLLWYLWKLIINNNWSSLPKVFFGKCVQKLCMKFTGEHPCRSVISIKFRTPFNKNTSGSEATYFDLKIEEYAICFRFRNSCLRILTGKKHRQIKLQRIQKVGIWDLDRWFLNWYKIFKNVM